MQKINPFLWFNDKAEEAANFYVSLFKNSKIISINRVDAPDAEDGPGAGTVVSASFQLDGQVFMALNGGPQFTFTPAVSFFVNCETMDEIEALWQKLSQGGKALMELDRYPFSEKFGWLMDQFGVSWQLNLESRRIQKITPCLMFVGDQHGKAEAAMNEYISLFNDSRIESIERYGPGEGEPLGTVKQAAFLLNGQEFRVMDSSLNHQFTFTPAISFFVNCVNQEEVDRLWEKLTEGGEEQPCGWLRDKYGVSWQIIPTVLGELLYDKDPVRAQRVMQAMLQMRKIEIDKLKEAYEGV